MFGFLGAVCDAAFGTDTCGVGDDIGELGWQGHDFGYHTAEDMLAIESSSGFDGCGFGLSASIEPAQINYDAATMGFEGWIDTPGLWSDPGVDCGAGISAFETDHCGSSIL